MINSLTYTRHRTATQVATKAHHKDKLTNAVILPVEVSEPIQGRVQRGKVVSVRTHARTHKTWRDLDIKDG